MGSRPALRAALLLILPLLLLLSACNSAPPSIDGVYTQLALVDNLDLHAKYEQLSVFVQASDENGIDDLAHLYVINDRAGIYWALSPDNWETRGVEGQRWVGSNTIVMPDGAALPRGEYRVELVDLSGAKDERSFVLDRAPTRPDTERYPTLTVKGQNLTIGGPYEHATVTAVDPAGRFSSRRSGVSGTVPVSRILGRTSEPGRRIDFYVDIYDADRRIVLISGPYVY